VGKASKLLEHQSCVYLPRVQLEPTLAVIHISKKRKEQTPEKRFALNKKKISHDF
jgi:hypothetical protein